MYSKVKIQYIVDVLAPVLIKELELGDYEIDIMVTTDPKKLDYKDLHGEILHGVTIWPNDRCDTKCTIVLFTKPCTGWKCAVDTLFHELLHVKIARLYRLASEPRRRRTLQQVDDIEEDIVSCISRATVKLAFSLDKLRDIVL